MKRLLSASMLICAMSGALVAHAANTATMEVRLNIVAACDVTATAPTIDFGSIPRTSGLGSYSAQGQLTVTCTNNVPYDVDINGGLYNTGDPANPDPNSRRMRHTVAAVNDFVPYDIYQDPAFGTFWGTNFASNHMVGNGVAQIIPVYARVRDVDHAVGQYADTLTVRIVY